MPRSRLPTRSLPREETTSCGGSVSRPAQFAKPHSRSCGAIRYSWRLPFSPFQSHDSIDRAPLEHLLQPIRPRPAARVVLFGLAQSKVCDRRATTQIALGGIDHAELFQPCGPHPNLRSVSVAVEAWVNRAHLEPVAAIWRDVP